MDYKILGAASLFLTVTSAPVFAEGLKPFAQKLELQGVTFDVSATNSGSQNKLTIAADGLEQKAALIIKEIEGTVTGAEVADLNNDGSPEVYVYVTSAGSGSYGSLVALAANNKKSLSEIYLPDITDDKKLSAGYMGHDEFSVVESVLGRRFPVYKPGDTNAKPTGGMRQIAYKLTPGEAGWVLRVKSVDNF
jgi:hypothetical protein